MLSNPLLHLNGKPEAVDTQSDDGKQEPLNEVTKKLSAGTVEGQSVAVDNGMLNVPRLLQTNCPRGTNSKSKRNDNGLENTNTYHSKKTAREFGFHSFALPFFKMVMPLYTYF